MYNIQTYYLVILLINFILNDKSFLDYANFFSPNGYEKNGK